MQKESISWVQALLTLCHLILLVAVFAVSIYAFGQSGLFSSWLSTLGYIALSFIITLLVNALLVSLYFACQFFVRIFDNLADLMLQTNKAAK